MASSAINLLPVVSLCKSPKLINPSTTFLQRDFHLSSVRTIRESNSFRKRTVIVCGLPLGKAKKLETFRDMDEELIGYIKRVIKLDIVNCHKLLNCIPSNMMQLFSHLRSLLVRECECLEEIFESNDSMLQLLNLFSLPKLKNIWKNHGQILGFECLALIIIKQCNDLKYVFPDVSIATSLPNLAGIGVYECEKIEEIIGNNCNHVETQQHKANKIIFPSLCEIILKKLPSLKWFSQSSFPSYVEMPQCYDIEIENCPEMKTFWDEGILYTPGLSIFLVENLFVDKDEDVNEVIQRHNK